MFGYPTDSESLKIKAKQFFNRKRLKRNILDFLQKKADHVPQHLKLIQHSIADVDLVDTYPVVSDRREDVFIEDYGTYMSVTRSYSFTNIGELLGYIETLDDDVNVKFVYLGEKRVFAAAFSISLLKEKVLTPGFDFDGFVLKKLPLCNAGKLLSVDEVFWIELEQQFHDKQFDLIQDANGAYVCGDNVSIHTLSFDSLEIPSFDEISELVGHEKFTVTGTLGKNEFTVSLNVCFQNDVDADVVDSELKRLMFSSTLSIEYYMGPNIYLASSFFGQHPVYYKNYRSKGNPVFNEHEDLLNEPRSIPFTNKILPSSEMDVLLKGIGAERLNVSKLNTIKGYEKSKKVFEVTINNKDYFGFAFRVNPLLVFGTETALLLSKEINRLSESTIIQSFQASLPLPQDRLQAWFEGRTKRPTPEVLSMAKTRLKFAIDAALEIPLIRNQPIQSRENYNFIVVMMPVPGDFDKKDREEFFETVTSKRTAFQSALHKSKLAPNVMSKDELHYIMWHMVNMPALKVNPHIYHDYFRFAEKDFDSLIAKFTRIRPHGNSLKMESYGESMDIVPIMVEGMPSVNYPQTTEAVSGPLFDDAVIPCPFVYFTNIEVMNKKATTSKLRGKISTMKKQLFSTSEQIRELMKHLYKRRSDTDRLIEDIENGQNPVKMTMGMTLFTPDSKVKKNEIITDTIALFDEAGYTPVEEDFIAPVVWKNSLPFGYDPLINESDDGIARSHLGTSLNATSLFHLQGDWTGTDPSKGGMLVNGRRGQTSTINIYDSSTNYNFITVADSGGGKSFFNNELVSDVYGRNGIVRILDVGDSYKRICTDIYGGEYIDFDPEKPMSINPFWGFSDSSKAGTNLKEGEERSSNAFFDAVDNLVGLLEIMSDPRNGDVDKNESVFLEDALIESWKEQKEHLEGEHIYKKLVQMGKDSGDQRVIDLANRIKKFLSRNGVYGVWFNGKPEFKFTNDFAVLELEKLNQQMQLRNVILPLIINYISTEMYLAPEAKKRPTVVLIDEAWDLMGAPKAGKFIETAFRRARKYFSAIGVITQKFGDFEQTEAGQAAISQSAWKFILKQSPQSIRQAIEQKEIEEGGVEHKFIEETSKEAQYYSNVYVKNARGNCVYRFPVDPISLYLFTTDREKEIPKLEAYKEKYGLNELQAVHAAASEVFHSLGILESYRDYLDPSAVDAFKNEFGIYDDELIAA